MKFVFGIHFYPGSRQPSRTWDELECFKTINNQAKACLVGSDSITEMNWFRNIYNFSVIYVLRRRIVFKIQKNCSTSNKYFTLELMQFDPRLSVPEISLHDVNLSQNKTSLTTVGEEMCWWIPADCKAKRCPRYNVHEYGDSDPSALTDVGTTTLVACCNDADVWEKNAEVDVPTFIS